MTAIPTKSALTGASVTEGEFKTALETLHDYLTGQLGSAGTQAAALAALGVLGGSVSIRSTAYTVVTTDRGQMILCSGTFTLSLTSVATLGAGFCIAVVNTGTGVITVDPAGIETVGGKTTLMLAAGASAILIGDGVGWQVIGASGAVEHGYQLFTASGTFNVPAGVTKVKATIIGGGGGGGSAYFDYSGANVPGGNGGYGGQMVVYVDVTPFASMPVTVGSGGAGSNSYNVAGSSGSASTFSSFTANGGDGGGAVNLSGAGGVDGASGSVSSVGLGFGLAQYAQNSRRARATSSTSPVAYSAAGSLQPGAGGMGESVSIDSNATGGVGGLVLIEW